MVFLGLWLTVTRLIGPRRVEALPATLPNVVRHPAPSPGRHPPAQTDIGLDQEVQRLHAEGLTGRHVGIAVVDRPLLTTHREFADRLRWYDEIDTEAGDPAGWHSTAVASIAAGARVGVARQAGRHDLEWRAARQLVRRGTAGVHTGHTLPLAIRRVLALNTRLPADRRIRAMAIAIAIGGASDAIAEARAQGIFVSAMDLDLSPYGPVTMASPAAPDAYTSHDLPTRS
jgi:subtilisin family serine protease